MSFEDYKTRFESEATNPEAVVKLLVEGMLLLETDKTLGEQVVCLVSAKTNLQEDSSSPSGFKWRRTDDSLNRLLRDKNIARSYAGGVWTSGYDSSSVDPSHIVLDKGYSASRQGINYPQQGKAKFFVKSGGADTPRPVTLACNASGQWKVMEFSSLTVGVRKPQAEALDF
ncbi:hypothetical protein QOT17_008333 [Balamuthia mandrillaris]